MKPFLYTKSVEKKIVSSKELVNFKYRNLAELTDQIFIYEKYYIIIDVNDSCLPLPSENR